MLLAGDRKRESLFPVLGIRSNATIQVLGRFSRAGWIRLRPERRSVAQIVQHLKIRTPSLEQPVQFLSGGNQQKVALTRTHLRESVKVILADEPTQGVDVRSRFDIYEALRAKAAEGTAIIVKSSDPIELSGFCDRVMVMSRGQIIREIPQSELSEKRIIEAIVGGLNVGGRQRSTAPIMTIAEQADAKWGRSEIVES
jgi:ribose transport system ATP-binding protein